MRGRWILVLLALVAGDADGQEPVSAGVDDRPVVGLVLSGGGARGFAHLGVLKVLHELRVARNRAVHGMHPIPDQDAAWFMDTTRKVLRAIHARPPATAEEAPA